MPSSMLPLSIDFCVANLSMCSNIALCLLFSDEFPEFRTGWTMRDARVTHLASADSPYNPIKIQPDNELLNDYKQEKATVFAAVVVTVTYLIVQVRAE